MDLVIDIGNTRTKAGLFAEGRLLRSTVAVQDVAGALRDLLGADRPLRIGLGRVGVADAELYGFLRAIAPVTALSGGSPAPIRTAYATPGTLGVDRWAHAVAAAALFPGRPVLAISLGTCITTDLVDADGLHRGGLISPGQVMRARAMHAFTAALPEVIPPDDPPLLGLTTDGALAAGIHHGIRAELGHTIAQLRTSWPDLAVVLTGGDAVRYAKALENGIFAHPYLTLIGLRILLSHAAP